MQRARVIRLSDTEVVLLGTASDYRLIVGDAGSTPVRRGIHASPRRIAEYKAGVAVDARGSHWYIIDV